MKRWLSVLASLAEVRKKGVSTSGNGNSADGRDHWPYCYTESLPEPELSRAMSMGNPTRQVLLR